MSHYPQIGKTRSQKVFRFLLLYNILETVYRVVQAVDGRAQAFIQMDGDLRYLIDGVSVQMQEFVKSEDASAVSFTTLEEEDLNAYASPIAFEPPMLDFHNHAVGMPHMKSVVIKNLSPDTSIHMLSISGNTLHFHCSFFQEKVIPPGGNTTFDVVFLARQEGPVENTLFIHTSLGSFKYQVTAVGTPNPYRLRPFVGVRMPLNSSFSPIIHMHNPHSSTLQLTEMYSSGGDLHLELPSGESEASKKIWEIPPYETKPIVKANFIARIEKNHTAFIRIRTNGSSNDYLILPVEVDVTSAPGIYSPMEVLDFGVLRSQDEPKELPISLLNSGHKHVHIVNVIVTPVNEAVDVKFTPIKVPPDTVFSAQVATVTFFPSKVLHPKQCSGKIVVKSKNNQFKLQIPYQVQLIKGSLDYNKSCTRFYVGQDHRSDKPEFRQLNVTNNFNITLILYSVSLPDEAKPHFAVNLTEPIVLLPGKSSPTVLLTFQPSHKNLQLTTYVRLHTNISYFDIPLLCFSGRLKVFLPHAVNESLIDFGTLGLGDKRTMIFAVINENPVDVNLKLWGSNSTKTYVELVGVDKGNASTLAWRHNFSSMARSLVLKPQHYAIFRIGITAPAYEGLFSGQAFVETQYEKINVPFSLRTAKGSLRADDIYFENSFPGKISSQNLYVHSSFSHSMTVTSVTPTPEDQRFTFDILRNGPSVLHPNSRNLVGKLLFDPRKICKNKCYSGLPTTTSMGHQWLLGMALSPDVGDIDKELYRTLRNRWQSLLDFEGKSLNVTLRLDTTEVRDFLLKAHATLQWPRLFSKYNLKFPVTQIGNLTVKDFTLENPSSLPLLVQVVPLKVYPNCHDVVEMLTHKLGREFRNFNQVISDAEAFTLEDLEEFNPNPENHIPAYRKSLEEYFGIQSHKQSIAMLLTPGMRVRIQVGFSPKSDSLKSSIILIRNNLTVLDAFVVQGQGGHGEIKFGNISPGSDAVLMFELTEKHLKDCDGKRRNKFVQPNFTVRRAFTARNTGALPVYIQGFDINGIPCEAYGFRVLSCQGFELKPNSSKKVDIAFTPDFTLSRIERTLNIHTSQGPDGQTLHFNLVATVPRHMLVFCSQALPRPHWESVQYYCFVCLTCFTLVCVLIAAYFESDRIIQSCYVPIATIGIHPDKIEKGHVFDLKTLTSCSSTETQSSIKNNSCLQGEIRKKKDTVLDSGNLSENYPLCTSKNSSFTKNKEINSLNVKDHDDCTSEHNNRHARKRTKSKQTQDNFNLDPDLCEIKKTQARNSWTHFLKPTFSFRAYSESRTKPSVATQTSNDPNEGTLMKALEELDIGNEQDISSLVGCENSIKGKAKIKKDSKYGDLKSRPKKQNDVLPEEETSSTTTETSTTESDISEKDHRLPDVCVTTKTIKSRHSKNKLRDNSSDYNERLPSKCHEVVDGDGFELSTKSRAHKKIKVDPSKVFGGDLLRPSTLELPYKPKPVSLDEEKEDNSVSESHIPLRSMLHPSMKQRASYGLRRNSENQCKKQRTFSITKPVKSPVIVSTSESEERNYGQRSPTPLWDFPLKDNPDATLANMVHQTENFALQRSFRPCNWSSSPNYEPSPVSSLRSNHCAPSYPSSYSAVLSKDICPTKKCKVAAEPICNKNSMDNLRTTMSLGQQRQSVLFLPSSHNVNNSSASHQVHPWNASSFASLNLSHSPGDLSGSKLRQWILHPQQEYCSSGFEHLNSVIRDELHSENSRNLFSDDWPGFDVPVFGESLWDTDYNPATDSWASNILRNSTDVSASSEDKTSHESVSDIWDNSGVASDWGTSASELLSPSPENNQSTGSGPVSSTPAGNNSSIADSDSENKNSSPEIKFDPFHSLSSLWVPQVSSPSDADSTSTDSKIWSFSLFSDTSSPPLSTSEVSLSLIHI